MRVHFICNGNAYRSRLAEGYFQSLHTGIPCLSSGIWADKARAKTDPISTDFTKGFLARHGVECELTPHPVQLTESMIHDDDVTIMMNPEVLQNVQQSLRVPENVQVWDITDQSWVIGSPEFLQGMEDYTAKIFAEITANVDQLVLELQAK